MTVELWALLVTAAALGLGHTLIGPDHYVPFIVMARARNWSIARTFWMTLICGVGHVLSSVVLGSIGIAAGIALSRLEWFEGFRGNLAAWLLTGFGFVYMVWGIHRAIRNRPHTHVHLHGQAEHEHEHTHQGDHTHVHAAGKASSVRLTPWILFTIFVFGPCEPLIPLLMFPAARQSAFGVVAVAVVFSVATIGTMLAAVLIATFGLTKLPSLGLQRYMHALAGAAVFACGLAIHLGL